MQQQVRYHIKHQGDYFYKISNEEDKYNFRITKFRVSDDLKSENSNDSVKIETKQTSEVQTNQSSASLTRLGGKFELMPKSEYLSAR